MKQAEHEFGFVPEHDAPIPYMQRIRDYYLALGYETPYLWAHYAEVPFQPLTKPLGACRVALITTAAPYQPGKGEQGPGGALQCGREILHRLFRGQRRRARSTNFPCRD